MKSYIILPLLLILLTIGLAVNVSGYVYQIPICSTTNTTDCLKANTTTGINGIPAIIFYQNGYLYVTNETSYNFTSTVYYNVTNITTYINLTNITYQNVSYITYMINNSNGSSVVYQQNITVDNTYIRRLFNDLYSDTNFSRYYNKTEIDNTFATQNQFNTVSNNMINYASKGDLVTLDSKFSNMNNLNNINWTSFNLTQINEHIDNGGDFSMTWKVIVIVEGVIILLLLLFVARSMMNGGGDY